MRPAPAGHSSACNSWDAAGASLFDSVAALGAVGGAGRGEEAREPKLDQVVTELPASATAGAFLGWAYFPGLPESRQYLDGIVVD